MTYIKNTNIKADDSPSIDAFGRWRVSQITTQYDQKQIHDNLPLFIDQELTNTATSSHSADNAETKLATSAIGDIAIAQTKQRFNYQSGKSQLLYWTFNNFNVETGITKKIGYFSSSTISPFDTLLDGFYLQSDSSTGEESLHVYRKGTITATSSRSNWDDPLDGSGISKIT